MNNVRCYLECVHKLQIPASTKRSLDSIIIMHWNINYYDNNMHERSDNLVDILMHMHWNALIKFSVQSMLVIKCRKLMCAELGNLVVDQQTFDCCCSYPWRHQISTISKGMFCNTKLWWEFTSYLRTKCLTTSHRCQATIITSFWSASR